MFAYKNLVFVAVLALIISIAAPLLAAPIYYNGGPSCVEDNGLGPREGDC